MEIRRSSDKNDLLTFWDMMGFVLLKEAMLEMPE